MSAGEVVAQLSSHTLRAPLAGVLRGLIRDGVPVSRGTKVIEIDPRGDSRLVYGIGERPARISAAVLAAICGRAG